MPSLEFITIYPDTNKCKNVWFPPPHQHVLSKFMIFDEIIWKMGTSIFILILTSLTISEVQHVFICLRANYVSVSFWFIIFYPFFSIGLSITKINLYISILGKISICLWDEFYVFFSQFVICPMIIFSGIFAMRNILFSCSWVYHFFLHHWVLCLRYKAHHHYRVNVLRLNLRFIWILSWCRR